MQDRFQIETLGPADFGVLGRNQARQIDDDVGLERGVLEEIRHHHLWVGVALQLQCNPHIVRGDVLDVEERRQLAGEDDVSNPLDQRRLVHRVRNALDVDRLGAARFRPFVPGSPEANRPRSRLVDLFQLVNGIQNLTAGWKVRTLDVAAQLGAGEIRVVEQFDQRRADLAKVVRRHVRRHADRDAGRAVDQQVRNACRQHDRLGLGAVVVRAEVDRVLIDLGQHLVGDAGETAFGVAHRRGAVTVQRAEVAGAIDEGIPERKRLRHPDQHLVQRHVAMRVIAAHHVAHHLRALAMLHIGGQVLLPHRVQDAALYRLEAVADVGQRARRDHRQRVVQVAALRRLVQRNGVGRPAWWWRWRRVVFEIEQRGIGFGRSLRSHRIAIKVSGLVVPITEAQTCPDARARLSRTCVSWSSLWQRSCRAWWLSTMSCPSCRGSCCRISRSLPSFLLHRPATNSRPRSCRSSPHEHHPVPLSRNSTASAFA